MDKEPEDLQFLNLFGFLKEPFKILRSHARLFTSVAVTFVLPLCFIILGHYLATEPLLKKISHNEDIVSDDAGSKAAAKSHKELAEEWTKLGLIFAAYLVFLLAFSLLSTAAIVYSVACIYTEKALSYRKVLSVIPKVWKRLIITFFWAFLLMLGYHIAFVMVLVFVFLVFGGLNYWLVSILLWLVIAIFFAVLTYVNCIWQLASVITVLEESYGYKALRRSVHLIQGKNAMGFCLFGIYVFVTFFIGVAFNFLVVHGQENSISTVARVGYGVLFTLVLTCVTLLGMLLQTVFYFACKSYHHESIDRLSLSEHLGAYVGEYVPLRSSIQMESLGV